jgi:hypothetical protein
MSPHELLDHLHARGVEVRVAGPDLLLVPKSRMTTAIMEAASRMKPELLGLLRAGAAERAAEPARPFREATSLLARLVSGGSRFEVLSGDGHDHLVWFAPPGMSHERMAAVARLEPEIVELLRTIGPVSAAGARQ